MATCQQLATQRSQLNGQVSALNTQIEDLQESIDVDWASVIAAEATAGFAGTLPTQDITSISNRCVVICEEATSSQFTQAQNIISQYQAIIGLMGNKSTKLAQLAPLQQQLTGVVLSQLNQGCLN